MSAHLYSNLFSSDFFKDFSCRVDPSTKLGNHVQLAMDIKRIKESNPSESGALIVVEILDHDLVRRIFIASGSDMTDQLLCEITRRLRNLLSKHSRLYYVGVGRFGVLTSKEHSGIETLMASIKDTMSIPFESGNYRKMMDIVIGALPMAEVAAAPLDALRKATVAAHKAREELLPIAHYSLAFDALQLRKHRILQEIPEAIASGQFSLVFQPKIDVTGAMTGAEALLRWQHPELGCVSPGEFIPLADDTELMVDITRWVVREVLRCCRLFVRQGLDLKIALNVSSRNLNDAEFPGFMLAALGRFDVPASKIQIECTEYSALKADQCIESLRALSRAGLTIALDDFGSGHSNLASLQSLPIDLLKIDRSLIAPIADSPHSLRLLEGVIKLAKSLGYKIVAEGVETGEILRMLQSLGIDEMQGYAIAKPMDFHQLSKFAESRMAPSALANG